jgi:MoaA/NifB/PqqE/SkfB family radical SAM enzyme
MYLMLTDRCNMSCEHCCFSCTKNGTDMSLEVFEKALSYCDEYVTLGGGEPTLHPQFEKMLCQAMTVGKVLVITNGSIKQRAMLLAKLAQKDVIDSQLSLDQFHDQIDCEVMQAFFDLDNGIRNTTADRDPLPHGRAKEYLDGNYPEPDGNDCCCDELICRPNGDVYACGCNDSPKLGNILDDNFDIFYYGGECCHSEYFEALV